MRFYVDCLTKNQRIYLVFDVERRSQIDEFFTVICPYDGQKATMAIDTFLGFCGILIAYWVYEDGQKLDDLEEEKLGLERRISELDGQGVSVLFLMKEKKKSLEERVSDLESNKKT
jgi:hypothetical protein